MIRNRESKAGKGRIRSLVRRGSEAHKKTRAAASAVALGSLEARGGFLAEHRDEVRRRIDNVCRRARSKHGLVSLRLDGEVLEVRTTSQQLTHRIAAELSKAFGGTVRYEWSDRDRSLWATWEPRAVSA